MEIKLKALTEQKQISGHVVIYPVVAVRVEDGRLAYPTPLMVPIRAELDEAIRAQPDWEAKLKKILRTRAIEKIQSRRPVQLDHIEQDLELMDKEF